MQKRNYKTLAGMSLMFDDLDTVFHISDFIGKEFVPEVPRAAQKRKFKSVTKKSAHSAVAEPNVKYRKR